MGVKLARLKSNNLQIGQLTHGINGLILRYLLQNICINFITVGE